MILPTVVVSKAEAFCNLPVFLVNKFEGRLSLVIQFRWQETGANDQCQYVQWIGGLSNSDDIELPSSQFNSPGSRSTVLVEAVLTDVVEAEEVYFVPDSSYDWDIITTQAEIVEEKLLTQLSIAYEGQKIRLQISSSLTVVLKCTGFKIKAAAFTKSHATDSASNSGAVSDFTSTDQGVSEIDGTSVIVARLTADTLAIVAPFVSSVKPDLTSKVGVGSIIGPSTTAKYSTLNLIEVGSALHPLRTLPHLFRSFDTGHRGKSISAYRPSKFEKSGLSLNICSGSGRTSEASCSLNGENSSSLIEEMLLVSECEETSREFPTVSSNSTQSDDISCFVHPSFLDCAYFTGANSVANGNFAPVPWCREDSDDHFNLHSNFIGILWLQNSSADVTARKGNQIVKPLVDSLIVGVKLSNSVRPLHISLHSSVQKAVGASDFSLLRLKVLGTCGLDGMSRFRSPIVPFIMSLQPLVWKSVREDNKHGHNKGQSQGQGQGQLNGKHATDTLSTPSITGPLNSHEPGSEGTQVASGEGCENSSMVHLDAIRESFVRLFEKHRTVKGKFNREAGNNRVLGEKPPLVLGSGSIITLTHENFDRALPQDKLDPLKKAPNGLKSNSEQIRRPVYDKISEVITVDYLVHVHKNKSSYENKKNTDSSESILKSKDESTLLAGTYDKEYCVIDSHEILFDCIDVMMVKEEKIVLTIDEELLKGKGEGKGEGGDDTSRSPLSGSKYQRQCTAFDQHRPYIGLKELLITNKAAGPVTVDVLSCLLPTAVRNSLHSCAPIGSILVGPKSSGKSLLCQSLTAFLRDSCKVVAHTEYLDCKDLKGRPTQTILDRMSDVFKNAQKKAPSFICLDNLDLICPAQPEGSTGISATQQRLVSFQLECFLANLAFTSAQNYRSASESVENLHRESNGLKSSSSSSDARDAMIESKSHSDRLQNGIDVAVGRVLRGSVYVLATGKNVLKQYSYEYQHIILITLDQLTIVKSYKSQF